VAKPKDPDFSKNLLFYGDNLDVMRKWIKDETIDLIYLDPPFNSNRTYNVLFKQKSGLDANAQITAFDDTWTWSQDDEIVYSEILAGSGRAADAIHAVRQLIGPSDMLSYLVMMTARLIEMRRVLKPNGSLYLHCDPVASHYLKVILDAIFGADKFVNEIIWKRSSAHSDGKQGSKHYGRVSDTILFYSKSEDRTWNVLYQPYDDKYVDRDYKRVEKETGRIYRLSDMSGPGGAAKGNPFYEVMGVSRHWRFTEDKMKQLIAEGRVVQTRPGAVPQYKRYLDEMPGVPVQNIWTDVPVINNRSKEKLGYPTQKPLALLERIIQSSSNEGDIILDPFCGCGTAVDAAQRLGRRWIGMDISYLSIDLIDTRMVDTYGPEVTSTYEIVGVPRDAEGAEALFKRSPFDFERWAVSMLDGTPNEKQVGDRGVDGRIRFPASAANDIGMIVISVKGGNLNPAMVRDLAGTVEGDNAAMGILITNQPATKGMVEAAQLSGTYAHPLTGTTYPKVQLVSIAELLDGKRPKMPTAFMPYLQAPKFVPEHPTLPGL
jgi:DNA modification methylase